MAEPATPVPAVDEATGVVLETEGDVLDAAEVSGAVEVIEVFEVFEVFDVVGFAEEFVATDPECAESASARVA